MLKDYPDDIESSNRILETKFFYYKGITSLLGKKNNSEALFYLHRGSEISRDINIYNILSMNAIGILYELEDDIEKAKVYYDKSLQLLSEFKLDYPLEQCRIYYNTAKFYSLIKDYAKSIELSDKGIEINRTHSSIYSLDCLLYEKAFNKQMLGLDAVEDYRIAYYFTRFFENKNYLLILKKICKSLTSVLNNKLLFQILKNNLTQEELGCSFFLICFFDSVTDAFGDDFSPSWNGSGIILVGVSSLSGINFAIPLAAAICISIVIFFARASKAPRKIPGRLTHY